MEFAITGAVEFALVGEEMQYRLEALALEKIPHRRVEFDRALAQRTVREGCRMHMRVQVGPSERAQQRGERRVGPRDHPDQQ